MCVANSARSQLAEALAKKLFPEADIQSAGSHPKFVNTYAIKVLNEIQIDISAKQSKSVNQLPNNFVNELDYVITLCAEEVCPTLFAPTAKRLHWGFEDPASDKSFSEEEFLVRFRKTRDSIQKRLEEFKRELEQSAK